MRIFKEQVELRIKTLPFDTVYSFSEAKVKEISTDTLRKILHRLNEKGVITIVARGHFKRIKPVRELLFVYGSLKKGFDNHNLLDKRFSKRIGKAKTVKKFGMFEDSFGNYPYLIDRRLAKVEGELYEIHRQELLDKLDQFEGTPDYYIRKRIEVKSHHGTCRAFVYIKSDGTVPIDQEPLKIWEEQTAHKVKRLHSHLDSLIGD